MLSFQTITEQSQDLVHDYSTDAKTFLQRNINIGQRILETDLGSYYTEETIDIDTEDETGTYDTPADLVKVKQAFVTVDETTQYNLEQIYDEDRWQAMKASMIDSYSDAATHIFVRRDSFEIFPAAENEDNVITLRYEAGGKLLQYDDYTEGTITTLANGAAAVTGGSTTFTAAMAGRYFKIDADGVWYKILTYTSATAITLDRNYQGTSIAAGTDAYTIGEMPRTPASTHHIPALYAAMNYYLGYKQDEQKARMYKALHDSDTKAAITAYHDRYASNYQIGGYKQRLRGRNNPNYPPGILT